MRETVPSELVNKAIRYYEDNHGEKSSESKTHPYKPDVEKLVTKLEGELIFLGLNEGAKIECADNQYKDGKKISIHTRELFTDGKLNELQARFYQPTRPTEELYDLKNDPNEFTNLADDSEFSAIKNDLASRLLDWMESTQDPLLKGAVTSPHHHETFRQMKTRR